MIQRPNRVVVTGYGCISALGSGLAQTTTALRTAQCGIRPISLFPTTHLPVRIAGEALDFKPQETMDAREIRRNDRFIQLCLAATDMAVTHSQIDSKRLSNAGVAMGVGFGGLSTIEEGTKTLEESGAKKVSPFFIPSILANLASGHVSIRFKTQGPNFAVSSACASGSQAIGQAYREIREGRREVWIAGGAEAPITPLSIAGFAAARALSRRNEDPNGACRPFSKNRQGFVLGEGAATLILESLQSAQARQATIYGEIRGFGFASDGYHITEPHPEGRGAYLAMSEALSDQGVSREEIDYVNAHATGTPLGDEIETRAMNRLFGDGAPRVYVSSTKSLTGHACGAAGALEAVFCLLMLNERFLAPAHNLDQPEEEFKFRSPAAKDPDVAPKLAMNNSFGFGGINTSMLFARWAG